MDAWQVSNNHYLDASLRWLRLRLQRLTNHEAPAAGKQPVTAARRPPSLLSRWISPPPEAEQGRRLLPEGNPPSLAELIEHAASDREKAARMDPAPALLLLAAQWGLSEFERDTLLLCAAVEFDPELTALYGSIQGNGRNYPTFALALSIFDEPTWDALSAHRPLRRSRLLEISQPGATPLTLAPLRADERIVNYLKGLNVFDDRLETLFTETERDDGNDPAPSQGLVIESVLQHLHESLNDATLPVMQLLGVDTGSKLAVAHQVCAVLGRRLYRTGAEALPLQIGEIETLALLWQRETSLLPVSLYIDAEGYETFTNEIKAMLHRFLARPLGLVFVGAREGLRLTGPSFPVEVEKPTTAEQYASWRKLLEADKAGPEIDAVTAVLAGQFDLNSSDIHQVVTRAARRSSEPEALAEQLWQIARDLTRPRLNTLAQQLETKATWDDLVLPDEQMKLMRQIAGQVRERRKVYDAWGFARRMNRGFGISALFAGESGTGKTMAAEVLANDLKLNLYRIDLSAVVSKYIGETEKNLRALFDAAESGGAILFFDEADALFGKRSEVKDSHDRYANIEINYLLQRMEEFSGLAILATNMKSALDPAFMRRLRFIVNLPFPGLKERKLIWEHALPPQTPRKELDYERLARLNISGGNIHSIALNAAFMAAQNGQAVTMPILLAAARAELRKLDKPVHESEFIL
jgi:hypothetical protein